MRNLSTGANVYLPPARRLTPDISIRELHAHIHQCRYELSLFKHSLWPRFCFHVLQLSGQAPVLFPLSWFPKSKEDRMLVRLMRRWVIKPIADACLQSCEPHTYLVPSAGRSNADLSEPSQSLLS